MLFATVVAGRLSDRIGPGQPLFVGMAIFAAGLVVAGTAEHMLQLVGGRLVQGLGSGVMNTAAFVLIAHAFDARQRPRMFTYISTAWVLPAFVGPPISAWLTETLSWHWVFFAVLPLVVGGAACLAHAAHPDPVLHARRADRTSRRRPRCGPPAWWRCLRRRSSWPASAWTGWPSGCWSPVWWAWSSRCRG